MTFTGADQSNPEVPDGRPHEKRTNVEADGWERMSGGTGTGSSSLKLKLQMVIKVRFVKERALTWISPY